MTQDKLDQVDKTELAQFLREFGKELGAAEQDLRQGRDRYDQVSHDYDRRQALRNQIDVVRPDRDRASSKEQKQQLTQDLKRLQEKVAELDLSLESRLFAESGLNEVFWQAVRFGGLGVAIGWLLERWVG